LAHSVKGTAATIGAMSLSEAAAKLEKAISSQTPDVEQSLAHFGMALNDALDAIRGFLQEEDTCPDRQGP